MRLKNKHPVSRSLPPFWLAILGLLLLLPPLAAQEALRISLAGDLAAEAQKQARNAVGYYNLLWGPVALRCSAALGT